MFGGALYVWWQRRWVRVSLLVFLGLIVALVALPGREPDPGGLRADYRRGLQLFGQAKYVWGGETLVGIDCSGFVREGLVAGHLINGVRTLNGTSIRSGLALWWTDASALALRDGYRNLTVPLGEYDSVNVIAPDVAEIGDLAVTADGTHVLVYVGGQTWMQADPGSGRVTTAKVPSSNGWYETPVALMR